jgi:hypothetical protein
MTRRREPCRLPARSNGRCYLHGGISFEAPRGEANRYRSTTYPSRPAGYWERYKIADAPKPPIENVAPPSDSPPHAKRSRIAELRERLGLQPIDTGEHKIVSSQAPCPDTPGEPQEQEREISSASAEEQVSHPSIRETARELDPKGVRDAEQVTARLAALEAEVRGLKDLLAEVEQSRKQSPPSCPKQNKRPARRGLTTMKIWLRPLH